MLCSPRTAAYGDSEPRHHLCEMNRWSMMKHRGYPLHYPTKQTYIFHMIYTSLKEYIFFHITCSGGTAVCCVPVQQGATVHLCCWTQHFHWSQVDSLHVWWFVLPSEGSTFGPLARQAGSVGWSCKSHVPSSCRVWACSSCAHVVHAKCITPALKSNPETELSEILLACRKIGRKTARKDGTKEGKEKRKEKREEKREEKKEEKGKRREKRRENREKRREKKRKKMQEKTRSLKVYRRQRKTTEEQVYWC